ncbi:MAG: hypothetical protein ACLFQM_12940, partial [Fidelibacterota bacterium]
DLFTDDPKWGDWSNEILEKYSQTNALYINSIVYTEISIGFEKIEDVDSVIEQMGISIGNTRVSTISCW